MSPDIRERAELPTDEQLDLVHLQLDWLMSNDPRWLCLPPARVRVAERREPDRQLRR